MRDLAPKWNPCTQSPRQLHPGPGILSPYVPMGATP